MKKFNYILLFTFHFSLFTLALLTSCNNHEDERPGLWTSTDVISTYPGDTVTVSGQASCYCGLSKVIISCDAWGVNKVYELDGQKPVVWNFDYAMVVPANAAFNQELHITAVDKNGSEQKKTVTMKYVPATDIPAVTGLQAQQVLDYDVAAGNATLKLDLGLSASRKLKSASLVIGNNIKDNADADPEAVYYRKDYTFNSLTASVQERVDFSEEGIYPLIATVTDVEGNVGTFTSKIIVMQPENEDEIADYDRMYAFMGNEKESDYLYGYYIYMTHKDAYCYQVEIYSPSDDTEFFFSPKMESDGERKFGVSPFVDTKVISKQSQKGYVKGYKPGKGYWGLWVDLKNKTIEKWELDCSAADKSTLYVSADWNGWTFDKMNDGEALYQKSLDITVYKGNQWFYFSTDTNWTCSAWRTWSDGGALAGWWFSEDGTGDGAALPTITEDTPATITFDTATKWCFIKKK